MEDLFTLAAFSLIGGTRLNCTRRAGGSFMSDSRLCVSAYTTILDEFYLNAPVWGHGYKSLSVDLL
jgi:hypothetical protein